MRSPAARATTPLWAWPTVLSLDAPLLGVLWQRLFARVLEVPLLPQHVWLLAASIWLAYSADRWLDALRLEPTLCTFRHRFYHEHRQAVLWVWLSVLVTSVGTALGTLSSSELRWGTLLLVGVGLYLLCTRCCRRVFYTLPKEIQIGALFGAGVALFLGETALAAILPLGLFAGLCTLNCLSIALWEAPIDRAQGHVSWLQHRPYTARLLLPALLSLAGLSLGFAARFHDSSALCGAIALGALALAGLHLAARGLSLPLLRVLGDAVLLSPLLFLWLL